MQLGRALESLRAARLGQALMGNVPGTKAWELGMRVTWAEGTQETTVSCVGPHVVMQEGATDSAGAPSGGDREHGHLDLGLG